MQLMEKHDNGGHLRIADLERWPMTSPAACFFVSTTEVQTFEELKTVSSVSDDLVQHRSYLQQKLLKTPWRPDCLIGLVDWATISASRLHRPYTSPVASTVDEQI